MKVKNVVFTQHIVAINTLKALKVSPGPVITDET